MATLRDKSWCQGFGGGKVFPLALTVDQIHIIDIARALSNQGRYAGHTRRFYSVAEHSVRVSKLCAGDPRVEHWAFGLARDDRALLGLLHDASEAYLVDLPRPIKHAPDMRAYRDAERDAEWVIWLAFMVWPGDDKWAAVKEADEQLLCDEAHELKSPVHPDWSVWIKGISRRRVRGMGWSPNRAFVEFLRRFDRLVPGCVLPAGKLTRLQRLALRLPWPIAAWLVTRSFVGSRA